LALSRQITEAVQQLARPIVEKEGLELVDIEYKKEGPNWFLRIFIDREDGGVDLDDCTRISEIVGGKLDEEDPVPGAYILEVSSPGAERPLTKEKDFQKAVGKNVYITTYEPIEGQKVFEGVLHQFDGTTLTVHEKKKTFEIPLEKVAKARLSVVF
jgi:ribosome maturation factor RimP